MPYPNKFGEPCWTAEQVGKVISLTAQTSVSSAPYFLAAHSPFVRIIDDKAGRDVTEEEVFQAIFSAARNQAQVYVRGEPGTGKSHLIRWLRLRAAYAAEQNELGLGEFKLVLVSRGNGSLKDALGQIVSQLGSQFSKHVDLIRGAIDKLSDAAARDTLLSALALEIGTHWGERQNRPALNRRIQHLGQMLKDQGCGRWFKRDQGVIHKVIRRLTETSTFDEQQEFPEFSPDDFLVDNKYLGRNENSGQVIHFCDDLKEEEDLGRLCADALNTALKDAIRALTGLKGSDLLEIFTEIRRALGPKKSLAVFIEDVSVTGLDQDVVNAFEPRAGDDLCRMVAVLGIVDEGWRKLPGNQRGRATGVYEVGGESAETWASDGNEMARFTARYLNAVRSDDEDIKVIASDRFGADVTRSKCAQCPHKATCHKTFGSVLLDGNVEIGLFPFNLRSPQALLASLNETRYRSQRGLLDRVLIPALDQSRAALTAQRFPQPNLFSVSAPPINSWSGFTNRYCGGSAWDEEKRNRLKFLALFWAGSKSADQLAAELEPLRSVLGFPKFTAAAPVVSPPKKDEPRRADPTPEPNDPELTKLLAHLERWSAGEQLMQDNKFRELLAAFIDRCVAWEDERGTPIGVKKTLMSGSKYPRIKDQVMNPAAATFFVHFARTEETRALLESLLLFDRRGRESWRFEYGEMHKRQVSRWLRRHSEEVVDCLKPNQASLTQDAITAAVQMLAFAARLRDRKKLPEGKADRIEALFAPIWDAENAPAILSSALQEIADDIQHKHALIRQLLIQELGAGQGEADPKDFIDPVPVLNALDESGDETQVKPPSPDVEKSYWKPRFAAVARLNAYADLPSIFRKEIEALSNAVSQIESFMHDAGFDAQPMRENLETCLVRLVDLIAVQRDGRILPFSNPTFDDLWARKKLQDSQRRATWGTALSSAAKIVADKDASALLTFDPTRLKELSDTLSIARNHLELVEANLCEQEAAARPEGDSRTKLLKELDAIAALVQGPSDDKEAE